MNDERTPKSSITNMNFPSNSHASKPQRTRQEEKTEPRKVQKVIQGAVIRKKPGFMKRFFGTFLGEDVGNVKDYIVHDVLIPAMKNTIVEMFQSGVEMAIHGERRGTRTKRQGGQSYVSYNSMSNQRQSSGRREYSSQSRARHDFADIVLTSRGEAEEVLSSMVELVLDYTQCTVSDLYGFVGIPANFTDDKYGWDDLSRASVSRSREGYVLNLPRPILLD